MHYDRNGHVLRNRSRDRTHLAMLLSRALLLLAWLAIAAGFAPRATRPSAGLAHSRVRMQAERINTQIDLDSPKVVNMLELEGKAVYCRCWKSATFPLCNGAHAKHNEATGDNVGPLIVTAKKD